METKEQLLAKAVSTMLKDESNLTTIGALCQLAETKEDIWNDVAEASVVKVHWDFLNYLVGQKIKNDKDNNPLNNIKTFDDAINYYEEIKSDYISIAELRYVLRQLRDHNQSEKNGLDTETNAKLGELISSVQGCWNRVEVDGDSAEFSIYSGNVIELENADDILNGSGDMQEAIDELKDFYHLNIQKQ